MAGQWNLSVLHAALETGLLEGKCSLLRRAYPNVGNVKPAKPVREATSQFAN